MANPKKPVTPSTTPPIENKKLDGAESLERNIPQTPEKEPPEIPPEVLQHVGSELSSTTAEIDQIQNLDDVARMQTKLALLKQSLDNKINESCGPIFAELSAIMAAEPNTEEPEVPEILESTRRAIPPKK